MDMDMDNVDFDRQDENDFIDVSTKDEGSSIDSYFRRSRMYMDEWPTDSFK